MTTYFLKDPQYTHFVVLDDEFITIVAPTTGIVIALVLQGITRLKRFKKFNRFKKVKSILQKLDLLDQNISQRLLRNNRIKFICGTTQFLYHQLYNPNFFTVGLGSFYSVTQGLIVYRYVLFLIDIVRYYCQTRMHVLSIFKITFRTLFWIVYFKKRTLSVALAFYLVASLSGIVWYKCKSPRVRKFILVCTMVRCLNLCSVIEVLNAPTIRTAAFGLPIVEWPIQRDQFVPTAQLILEPTESRLERQMKLKHSFPTEKELLKASQTNLELEMDKVMNSSVLGEEQIPVTKKEGLQRGKARKTNATSKTKHQVNSLQKLNSKMDNTTSISFENELNQSAPSTQIKENKVK